MFAAYPIAAIIAGALSALELISRLRGRPTLKENAWVWWAIRLLIEGGVGVGAVILLNQTQVEWSWIVVGLVAGTSASAVLRLRLATIGEDTPIGIAYAYDRVRDFFDDRIERCGSENDSRWINDEVLPTLFGAETPPDQIGNRLAQFVKGLSLSRMDLATQNEEQAAIKKVLNDSVANDEKIRGLIEIGLRLKAFRTIKNLYETAQKEIGDP